MSVSTTLLLFATLSVLALIPTTSTLIVISRTMTSGLSHGLLASLGIATGDILFIFIAVFGLSVLAGSLGEQFVYIKYLAGVYLIWIGFIQCRHERANTIGDTTTHDSPASSFTAGLLFTLGDQKAILFYLGLLPAFIQLDALAGTDIAMIMLIAFIAVGGAKALYALASTRAATMVKDSVAMDRLNILSGIILIAIGIFLLASS